MASPLRAALRHRLTAAMRTGDRATAGALRSVLGALENAEAVPSGPPSPVATSEHVAGAVVGLGAAEVARRLLSLDEERSLVEREVAELRSASVELAGAGRPERAAALLRAAEAIEDVLEGTPYDR